MVLNAGVRSMHNSDKCVLLWLRPAGKGKG